jgi:hypothetical protein
MAVGAIPTRWFAAGREQSEACDRLDSELTTGHMAARPAQGRPAWAGAPNRCGDRRSHSPRSGTSDPGNGPGLASRLLRAAAKGPRIRLRAERATIAGYH